jgi:probable O-glycosylation ligase (exosortase A-associated)
MSIRDVVLTAVILGSLPVCFLRPWIGLLMWTWVGTMTPQELTWGFAHDLRFALMIGVASLAGLPFARDQRPLPRTRETYMLLALWAWFTLTTFFAISPDDAWTHWIKVSKILLFTIIALRLFQDRSRLRYLLLVLTLSIGFYGIKGGIWALLNGGAGRVEAPPSSYIGGNTGLGLGLNMAMPFFFFLAREESNRWLKRVLWIALVLSIPATVFTYSRGAAIGLAVVLSLLAIKANHKIFVAVGIAAAVVFILQFAPDQWFHRIDTIRTYEEDNSAMGRLRAWGVAYRLALERPIVGGGFWGVANDQIWKKYLPEEDWLRSGEHGHDAHSIWFNALGDQGFPGFFLFSGLILSCILTLRRLRRGRGDWSPPPWIVSYSHMLEASLVAYAVTGSFLSATYMDVFYLEVGFVILLSVLADREAQAARTRPSGVVAAAVPMARRQGNVRNRGLR